MRDVKANSSGWVHQKFPAQHKFAWQTGYAAFSVSHDDVDAVRAYIANQEEHHRTVSYQEEVLRFLQEYGIEYDERYLWD